MKTIVSKLFLLSILIISSLGCTKDKCSQINHDISPIGIKGEWKWVQSVGGFGGWTLTPKTECESRTMVIGDSIYQEFWDCELVRGGNYRIISKELNVSGDTLVEISSEDIRFQFAQYNTQELIMVDACVDCYRHFYIRE